MPGLRIHHPTLRNAVMLVSIPAKRARGKDKQVQIVVDDEGNALVSEGVWGELELALANDQQHQFMILNEVPDPPPLVLGGQPDVGRETYELEREALRQIAPAGVNAATLRNHKVPHNINTKR